MQELNPEHIQFLSRYLEDNRFIWVFQEDHPSPFLQGSIDFGDDDFTISVIDNFGGRQPILLNRDTVGAQESRIPFRPTAVLDSNIVSVFVQFVLRAPALRDSQRETVRSFLRFLVQKQLDYNPFFYFMEGFWKEHSPDFENFALRVSQTFLSLQCMDTTRFLQSDQIILDERILATYAEEFGESTFDGIAEKRAQSMMTPADWYVTFVTKVSYACILKMALIHKLTRKSIADKFSELRDFMANQVQVAMGAERLLSLGYFSGLYQSFIPLQRGANAEKVLRRIRAASWDLFLLRTPLELLARTGEHGISLSYVCTADRVLAEVARNYTLQMIISGFTENTGFIPVLSYDHSFLHRYLERKTLDRILESDRQWQKSRMSKYGPKRDPVPDSMLSQIVTQLEEDVRSFCTNSTTTG
ncbi:MAG: hypothetical protein HYY49_05100 [Ignavibacteriales bacterium]|nr:hypothetical protein [Ignavibacteriales bacterium]